MQKIPIDPLSSPQYALKGRIVTMDSKRTVINDGILYINEAKIVAVQKSTDKAPDGFADVQIVDTGGTIYPGLIELHNHLSYNILPLWDTPKKYTNRNQWGATDEYRKLISGPMTVMGRTPGFVEAVVRYVECKCLMGGVTTSQGIALFSNNGIQKYYRGIVRNVETTDDASLPEAKSKISDVEAASLESFNERLKRQTCLLLHLSEGTDDAAHSHFTDLKFKNGSWAITNALAGIHCVALKNANLKLMRSKGAAMIWSPLSNMLLYGQTADIASAVKNKLLIGIGSDWSPSGSKNLFGELKVARIVSKQLGIMEDADVLALGTINPAKILKWENELGSIEKGKRADLLVLQGNTGDVYQTFFNRSETAISLLIINGTPRYGYAELMKHWTDIKEKIKVGGKDYELHLKQSTVDPAVGALKFSHAKKKLNDGLKDLPKLAKQLESVPHAALSIANANVHPQWFLQLDHNDEVEGEKFRLANAVPTANAKTASRPLSELLGKINLDKITVADDKDFLTKIKAEDNLPQYLKDDLEKMYQ
jgi:5-methylthioadenosine/S-adenosylhomocysteine deaminase